MDAGSEATFYVQGYQTKQYVWHAALPHVLPAPISLPPFKLGVLGKAMG